MLESPQTGWIAFNLVILILLAWDLGVFSPKKKSHAISVKSALKHTVGWISLSVCFGLGLWWVRGTDSGLSFFAGYLIELSLSVDNLFVFILIFTSLNIAREHQHRILFWGVLGAIVMRAGFIFAGLALFSRFHFLIYIFGAFLIFTGIKILFEKEKEFKSESNWFMRWLHKANLLEPSPHHTQFFIKKNGRLYMTKLFVCVLFLEASDLVFALDSVPAVLAVSSDPFIVYTSNILAILGLRSLFFALSGLIEMFHYLKYGVCVLLIFVGSKMVLSETYKIPVGITLLVIMAVLLSSILASWARNKSREGR